MSKDPTASRGRRILRGTLARNSVAAAVGIQIEYATYFILIGVTDLHYLIASALSTSGGICVGFAATKYWAFGNRDHLRRHVGQYLGIVGIGVGMGLGGLALLSEVALVPASVARPLADFVVYCVWMYPANLFVFAFRPSDGNYRGRVRASYDDLSPNLYSHDESQRGFWGRLWKRLVSDRQMRVVLSMIGNRRGTALDVGCGSGLYSKEMRDQGLKVTAVDPAPRMLNEARKVSDVAMLGDVEHLDLQQSFDVVICIGVLDFVADVKAAVMTLAKHVAPGGRLVILVPVRSALVLPYYFYQLRRGTRVNLFNQCALDRVARQSGLHFVGSARPLPHNVVLAWERAA